MSTNQKIVSALSSLVNGNIWPLSKPLTEDPNEYIVFNPESDYLDYGDDLDQAEERSWQVHWFNRGVANTVTIRKQIRNTLRDAGFVIEPGTYEVYESDTGASSKGTQTGWTHITVVCRAEDE